MSTLLVRGRGRLLAVLGGFGAAAAVVAGPGWAAGPTQITTCTDSAVAAAIAAGGSYQFACDGFIFPSATYNVTKDVTLDASGHKVTFESEGPIIAVNRRLFTVNATLVLRGVTVDGFVAGGPTTDSHGADGAAGATGAGGTDGANGASGGAGGVGHNGSPGANGGDAAPGATAQGGALYIDTTGKVTLDHVTLRDNHALGGNSLAGAGGPGGGGGSGGSGGAAQAQNGIGGAGGHGGNGARGGDGGSAGRGGDAIGGAVYNAGTLTVISSTFSNNSAEAGDSVGGAGGWGGPGGAGGGGGLAATSDNQGRGGDGGTGAPGGTGGAQSTGGDQYGGAIYNTGSLQISDSTFTGNQARGGGNGPGFGGSGGDGGAAGDGDPNGPFACGGTGGNGGDAGSGGTPSRGSTARGGAIYSTRAYTNTSATASGNTVLGNDGHGNNGGFAGAAGREDPRANCAKAGNTGQPPPGSPVQAASGVSQDPDFYPPASTGDTLTVNSTADTGDQDTSDGKCDTGATLPGGGTECTLRAAIDEADNNPAISKIVFAIPGTPHIDVGSTALPKVTRAVSIDGTTQSGGWVEVQGPGTSIDGIVITAGPSMVKGLAMWGFNVAIRVDDGDGTKIFGNRLGVDATGTTIHPVPFGVGTDGGTNTQIGGNGAGEGNQAVGGLTSQGRIASVISLLSGSGTSVIGNLLNVDPSGTSALGGDGNGVTISKVSDVTVSGNTIAGRSVGISLRAAATGTITVANNHVGVAADGQTALHPPTYGIRDDGAAGASITGNTVFSTRTDISVSGREALTTTQDGGATFDAPSPSDTGGAITGTGVTVANNTVGSPVDSATQSDLGIAVWNGAGGTSVTANTASQHREAHLLIGDAAGTQVLDNLLGVTADGRHAAPGQANYGIEAAAGSDTTIGAADHGNVIGGNVYGIRLGGLSSAPTGTEITANDIGVGVNGTSDVHNGIGISLADGKDTTIGAGNLVYFNPDEISITGGSNTSVKDNKIGRPAKAPSAGGEETGVSVKVGSGTSPSAVAITGNVLGGIDGDAVQVGTGTVSVGNNGIGSDQHGAVLTNSGYAVRVADGAHADLSQNLIRHDTAGGVQSVGTGSAGVITNSIGDVGGNGIESGSAPAAPTITAVYRPPGSKPRLWVALSSPQDGLVELFENPSCDHAQAFTPLLKHAVAFQHGVGLLVLTGDSAKATHLTATLSVATGGNTFNTSPISGCADPGPATDSDGDGIPDAVEIASGAGSQNDAGTAVVPNDNGDFTVLHTSSGKLTNVGPGDAPAPPSGVSVPSPVTFTITGLTPNQDVTVGLSSPDGASGYWRYGPPRPGAAASWYAWPFDETTGLGAEATGPKEWRLHLRDGAAGDDDGVANGTIVDPGGPATGTPTGGGGGTGGSGGGYGGPGGGPGGGSGGPGGSGGGSGGPGGSGGGSGGSGGGSGGPGGSPGPAAPVVVTGRVTRVGATAATLNGTVNPNGNALTACFFEYGRSGSYGRRVACSSAPGAGHTAVPVTAAVGHLTPHTAYHFRLTVRTAGATVSGHDRTLTTARRLAPRPTATTGAAVAAGTRTVKLTGTVNAHGGRVTRCVFQYGTSRRYVGIVTCRYGVPGRVSALLAGLAPGHGYHYRLVVTIAGVRVAGGDRRFSVP